MTIERYRSLDLSAPDTKAGRLQRACLELLREHERDGALPTNGRFLFYENPGLTSTKLVGLRRYWPLGFRSG